MSEENNMDSNLNIELIKNIIKNLDIKGARNLVDEYPDAQIADSIQSLTLEEQLTILRLFNTASAASIYSYLDEDIQVELAKSFTEEWGMKLLQELQSDELVDVLDELPANVTSKILAYTNSEKRSQLNKLLSYNDNEVGSIMSIDISSLPNSYTCEQALNKIRRDYKKNKKELVHYYYVIGNTNQLLGVLTLEEISFAEPNQLIDDIYSPVAFVYTSDKKEHAAKIFSEHDMSVLPVVNQEKRLIGMITSDDVIDVIQEEGTEDLYKFAGISKKFIDNEYIKTPWYKLLQSRILWLSFILIFSTLTQIIIHWALVKTLDKSSANETIDYAILTISFAAIFPVLSITNNSAGTQSNISISRAITLNKISKKDYKKAILREMIVGMLTGFILAAINLLRLSAYYGAINKLTYDGSYKYWAIIIGTSIALFISILISSLFGALLPILMVKLKKDPSSIPIIILNVLSDIITVLITFGFTFAVISLL
ncbi:magnesium transporter [Mycoplasma sp. U97]|uniref:magnesium transporter n=1 Tax=Mycoplasma tauri TaxID=547987 RepID=UPI0019688072|nr:magnesium transporter [Mycoplasma tauri]MBZ4212501.1 magnesium transporter [Mycoplasma tauri]QSB07237.1 magnesium transporter [Mycoplasma tauri]